jgi:hypothetical protein
LFMNVFRTFNDTREEIADAPKDSSFVKPVVSSDRTNMFFTILMEDLKLR